MLSKSRKKGTPEGYCRNAYRLAEFLIRIIEDKYKVAITHGNSSQVSIIAEWMMIGLRLKNLPPMTLDIAGAMNQVWLGYIIQQSLYNKLLEKGLLGDKIKGVVTTIVTQMLVNKNDSAFNNLYIAP